MVEPIQWTCNRFAYNKIDDVIDLENHLEIERDPIIFLYDIIIEKVDEETRLIFWQILESVAAAIGKPITYKGEG